jgi:hypothetical protein
MYDVAAILQPVSTAIDAKLGRCGRCMRISATATAVSWALAGVAAITESTIGQAIALAGAVPLTVLSMAHGIAYLTRERVSAGGCTACEHKARERARLARRRRVKAWFTGRPGRPARQANRGCLDCKTSTRDELIERADQLPTADTHILDVIQASPEFQHVTPLLAQPAPIDSWMADMRHHFVFALNTTDDGRTRHALFAARWEDYGMASTLLVTQSSGGGDPIVTDIRALQQERLQVPL